MKIVLVVVLVVERPTTKTTAALMAQDLLLPEFIYPRLKSRRLGTTIHHILETGSTNDDARQLAEQGAPEGTLVLAEEQTQGRGRLGRSWLSERGAGIYASVLLRPILKPRDAAVLTLVAAVAGSEAIEQGCGLRADIKWPNDLLLSGRKCCGILSEMQAERDDIRYVIVGIGINVNHSVFPAELGQRATSLRIEGKQTYSRVALLCEFLRKCELLYDDLQRGNRAAVLQSWVDRSSFAFGKQVTVDLGRGKKVEGQTAGLSELGNLKVKLADGRVEEVMSGDLVAWR
ncbi:MAG TPA: biotin--[acetyl-CoA-carboxylase] ligase [Terriglobia bacterium]|nr:biotin--[acetyl-CoA-carboxylase] ligase [Terriglobia bacterium]